MAGHDSNWDESAEQSVIGALLLLPNWIAAVLEAVKADDFFSPFHGLVFGAIKELQEVGKPIDFITVSELLEGNPVFEGRGGRNYLTLLPSISVPAANVLEHAHRVKRLALARRTKEIARALLENRLTPAEAQTLLRQLEEEDDVGALPLLTARELCSQTNESPDWLVEHYVAQGVVTELTAKIKAGKTHFACDLAARVLAGEPFLGKITAPVPIIYLTEERASTFRSALARVGLKNEDYLYVLQRRDAPGEWPAVAHRVRCQAKTLGAGLVICDTLSDWGGLKPEEENDSAAALEAMRPLQMLADANLAVLVLRHERKAGGEVGDSARGSSAFGGAADILLSLSRTAGQGHDNRRKLEAVGRLDDIPTQLIIEVQNQRYVFLGDAAEIEARKARELLLCTLGGSDTEAISEKDILERFGDEVSRSTLKRSLSQLRSEGRVHRRKGTASGSSRAYGYWRSNDLSDEADELSI